MTQGDASLVASTQRNGSVPFRRNWAVAESRPEPRQDDRTSWQERMGLTIEEALDLPGLAGTSVAAGAAGLSRVVRHMVVDDPADPLAAAGPDVLVVLGARLPPADAANYRALVERLDSMGTAALAFRRTEGPAPVPGEVLAEADRRGLPVLALPPGVRLDEVVSEVLGTVVAKQGQALALSSRLDDEFLDRRPHRWRPPRGRPAAGGHPRRRRRPGPGARPRHRHQRRSRRRTSPRSATGCGCSTPPPTTPWPS